jgi:hypothetical protein
MSVTSVTCGSIIFIDIIMIIHSNSGSDNGDASGSGIYSDSGGGSGSGGVSDSGSGLYSGSGGGTGSDGGR